MIYFQMNFECFQDIVNNYYETTKSIMAEIKKKRNLIKNDWTAKHADLVMEYAECLAEDDREFMQKACDELFDSYKLFLDVQFEKDNKACDELRDQLLQEAKDKLAEDIVEFFNRP